MNIYAVPMLIAGVLCAVLSIVTWLFRQRENLNRMFSTFTLILAIDSFAFFAWFQFGSIENINTWMRAAFTLGLLVPAGLILFFYAFTGFDKRLDVKVLGIKVRHFQIAMLLLMFVLMVLSQFTDLLIDISETPEHIWDLDFGPVGVTMYPLFAGIFFYLFTMVFKGYKMAESAPQKRFILLLAVGTIVWLVIGYAGALLLPTSSEMLQSVNYLGTAVMAIFYFVAIVNYQSDKVHELNVNLEQKVAERTRHLNETRAQLIQSEKTAALGHLVAGVAHEMNSPVGAVNSAQNTLALATEKLRQTLENDHGIAIAESKKVSGIMNAIASVGEIIRVSSERISGIVKQLKVFAQLDEADLQSVDFNECIEDCLALFRFHLKPEISIRREFADMPAIVCYPAKINQLCFQLLRNANSAIAEAGEIVLRTEVQDGQGWFHGQETKPGK